MQELANLYADPTKIRVVQDNLNTHTTNAFYEHLPADEAIEPVPGFKNTN